MKRASRASSRSAIRRSAITRDSTSSLTIRRGQTSSSSVCRPTVSPLPAASRSSTSIMRGFTRTSGPGDDQLVRRRTDFDVGERERRPAAPRRRRRSRQHDVRQIKGLLREIRSGRKNGDRRSGRRRSGRRTSARLPSTTPARSLLIRIIVVLCALLAAGRALAESPAQSPSCGARLFLSGYFSTVHVFDACTGAYLRDLDTNARIKGPQAVKLGPDGLVYVTSENTQQILRYRNDTLEFVDVFATLPGADPTGFAFAPNGDVYVAAYKTSDVRRLSAAGTPIDIPVPNRAAGLDRPGQRHHVRSRRQPLRAGLRLEQRDPPRPADRRDERRGAQPDAVAGPHARVAARARRRGHPHHGRRVEPAAALRPRDRRRDGEEQQAQPADRPRLRARRQPAGAGTRPGAQARPRDRQRPRRLHSGGVGARGLRHLSRGDPVRERAGEGGGRRVLPRGTRPLFHQRAAGRHRRARLRQPRRAGRAPGTRSTRTQARRTGRAPCAASTCRRPAATRTSTRRRPPSARRSRRSFPRSSTNRRT